MSTLVHQASPLTSLLARITLFRDLPPGDLAPLAAAAREFRARRGDIICDPHDDPEGLYCVIEGQVKLALLSADGCEKVVDIVPPGMTFGESAIFLNQPFPVYAQALENAWLLHVGGGAVHEAITRCPALAQCMLVSLSQRLHHMLADLEVYCLQPAGQRVIGYLLREAEMRPLQQEPPLSLVLPVSKATIASRLNVTPETLSRVLHCLSDEGLISVDGRTIHVHDLDGLRACGPTRPNRV